MGIGCGVRDALLWGDAVIPPGPPECDLTNGNGGYPQGFVY